MNCSYNPHKSEIKKHLATLRTSLDLCSSKYEKILILGDFNVEIKEANMKSFCENYNLKSLAKQATCYKNPNKSTCIDLILTNVPRMFQGTRFLAYFKVHTLNSFAPRKRKYARGNQMPFLSKNLSKEIITRSRLRNKYLKHKTEENRLLYTQQRNKCVSLLRKTKRNYYGDLDEKDITDSKNFWKTVKPLLSDKSINGDKMHLNENGELINSESKIAKVLNEFFSNTVKSQ